MKSLKKLSTKKKVIISVTGFLFFCFIASLTVATENDQLRAVRKYLKANREVPIIHNIQLLRYWEDLYNYGTDRAVIRDVWKISEHDRSFILTELGNDRYRVTFTPQYFYRNKYEYLNDDYLNTINDYGTLLDYKLVFYLTNRHIDSFYTVLLCADDSNRIQQIKMRDKDFDISLYANNESINKQYKAIERRKKEERRIEKNRERIREENKDFEDGCLSSYDGSCPAAVDYIKRYMNDPNSFEHVQTKYGNAGEYMLIEMTYRGKNAFGTMVINKISLRVTKDCKIVE